MFNKLAKIIDQVIEISFYLLFFLTPLILTPFNYELFEFNKIMLVYLLTVVIVSAWLVKMVLCRKIIFKRTFFDLPLIFFFFSQIIATVFSLNRHTSLWGYYSRFHGSLFSTAAYLLLYWALVSNLNKEKVKKAIMMILAAAVLVAAYGIAEHFGIDARYWVQDVQNRVFSTLGQPNWLAAYLTALLPLSFSLILNSQSIKVKKFEFKKISFLLSAVFYLCLLYTKSRSGLIGFGVSFLLFWGHLLFPFTKKSFRVLPKPFLVLVTLLMTLTLLAGTPWTPSIRSLFSEPASAPPNETPDSLSVSESGDIRKVVWRGALEIWKNYPFFGTGVETFAYSYYQYRPREHNDLSEWDFLYNKAHNEYLNFMATTGTFGLLAYLSLIGTFFRWGGQKIKKEKKKENKYFLLAILAGYASIMVTNFFGFSVVNIGLFFFLFPGLALAAEASAAKIKLPSEKKLAGRLTKGSLAFITLGTFFCLFFLGRVWYADALFAQGEKSHQSQEDQKAYLAYQKAIKLRGREPFYHNALSLSAAHLAGKAWEKNDPALAEKYAHDAIEASRRTLELNPYHLNFWKNRVRVFYLLAEIDEGYNQQVLDSLLQATKLAPTDAKIFYNLALIYAQTDQEAKAIETFEKTVQLRPNYTEARYTLAIYYEKNGEVEKAKAQLKYILEKINPFHEAAQEKYNEINSQF